MSDDVIIWQATLDGRYHVKVKRIDGDHGEWSISDGERVLASRQMVPLRYGAMFGADVEDVMDWQSWAIDLIDEDNGGGH